jgi:hypothetical protein
MRKWEAAVKNHQRGVLDQRRRLPLLLQLPVPLLLSETIIINIMGNEPSNQETWTHHQHHHHVTWGMRPVLVGLARPLEVELVKNETAVEVSCFEHPPPMLLMPICFHHHPTTRYVRHCAEGTCHICNFYHAWMLVGGCATMLAMPCLGHR